MPHGEERFASFLKREIASFLERELERPVGTLVSITNVALDSAGERADVFVSVFRRIRGNSDIEQQRMSSIQK